MIGLLAGCSKSDMVDLPDSEHVPIQLKTVTKASELNSRAAYVGDPSTTNPFEALIVATTNTAGDYANLHASGSMIFKGLGQSATFEKSKTTGNVNFPEGTDPVLCLAGLYPATGWGSFGTTATITFTGQEDVMSAAQLSTSKVQVEEGNIGTLTFKHLLTKLDIRMQGVDNDAAQSWGKVQRIELIQAGGNSIQSKVTVTLADGTATYPSSTVASLKCYTMTVDGLGNKTYTDNVYVNQSVQIPAAPSFTYMAYTITAPITVSGTNDFKFRVYATGAVNGYVDVPVNLNQLIGAVGQNSVGKSYDVLFTFKVQNVEAQVNIVEWEAAGEVEESII